MRLILACALVLGSLMAAGPVAAGAVDVEGLAWRVWKPGHKALIAVRATDQGAEIVGAFKGLDENAQYRVIGTNGDGNCQAPVTAANRTFRFTVEGRPEVSFYVGTANGGVWKNTAFVRIRLVGGDTWACARVRQIVVDPNNPNVVYARMLADGSVRMLTFVEQLDADSARVFVAVGDVNGDGVDLVVRGNDAACGNPGTTLWQVMFSDVLVSSMRSVVVDMAAQDVGTLKSVRVKALTGAQGQDWFYWACRRPILIGLLLP